MEIKGAWFLSVALKSKDAFVYINIALRHKSIFFDFNFEIAGVEF